MKKYLLLVLLCSTSLAFACSACQCELLMAIVIKNNTSETCQLIQKTIAEGYLSEYGKENPTKILSGQTSKPFVFEDTMYHGPDVTLTFLCGDDKFVTIKSQKAIIQYWTDWDFVLAGSTLAVSNMDATFATSKGNCTDKSNKDKEKQFPSITWTLS